VGIQGASDRQKGILLGPRGAGDPIEEDDCPVVSVVPPSSDPVNWYRGAIRRLPTRKVSRSAPCIRAERPAPALQLVRCPVNPIPMSVPPHIPSGRAPVVDLGVGAPTSADRRNDLDLEQTPHRLPLISTDLEVTHYDLASLVVGGDTDLPDQFHVETLGHAHGPTIVSLG